MGYIFKKVLFKKTHFKQNKHHQLEYLKNQLLFGNEQNSINTICKAYNFTSITPGESKKHLLDSLNKKDLFFFFDSDKLKDEDLIFAIKNKHFQDITIFCLEYISIPIIEGVQINVENLNQIQNTLLYKNQPLDYNIKIKKSKKLTTHDILSIIFNSQKAKSYLGFGLLIMFSSLFTSYNIYYIIVGTLLLLLSLYSRFNTKFNKLK